MEELPTRILKQQRCGWSHFNVDIMEDSNAAQLS